MATNKGTFSIRTEVINGDQVRSQLNSLGEAGKDSGNKISAGMDKASVSLDRTEKNVKDVKVSVVELNRELPDLQGLIVRAFAIEQIRQFSLAVLEAGLTMEKIEIGLKQVTGSSEQASQEFQFLKDTADRLGTGLFESAQGFIKIAAAAKGTAVEGQAVRNVFVAISEASSVYRLTAEQTAGALKALEQIISKGKLSAEELRQQLAERLPGSFRIAAEAMGVTTAELEKMIVQGRVGVDFIDKFATAIRKEVAGSIEESSSSAQASLNRLSNEYNLMLARLADSGAMVIAADGASLLARNLDLVSSAAVGLSSVGLVVLITRISTGMVAAASAAGGLSAAAGALITPFGLLSIAIGGAAAALFYFSQQETSFEKATTRISENIGSLRQKALDLKLATGDLRKEKEKSFLLDVELQKKELIAQKNKLIADKNTLLSRAEIERDLVASGRSGFSVAGSDTIRPTISSLPLIEKDLNNKIKQLKSVEEAILNLDKIKTEGLTVIELPKVETPDFTPPKLSGLGNFKSKDVQKVSIEDNFTNIKVSSKLVEEYIQQLETQLAVESSLDETTKNRLVTELQLKENITKAETLAEQEIQKLKNNGVTLTENQIERITSLTKATLELSEAKRIEAERQEVINSLNSEYLSIVPNLEVATEAINKWKEDTVKALEAVGEATPENLNKLNVILQDKLDVAYENNLEEAKDWSSGVERAFRKIAKDVPTQAKIAEKAVEDFTKGVSESIGDMLAQGELDLNSFTDLLGSISRQISSSIISSEIQTLVSEIRGSEASAKSSVSKDSGSSLLSDISGFAKEALGSLFEGDSSAIDSVPLSSVDSVGEGVDLISSFVAHTGSKVGETVNITRQVPSSIFNNAPRFHNGGFPGLRPDEVPAILEKGETVIPKGTKLKSQESQNINITMNITTPNVESFRSSKSQVIGDMSSAINQYMRRNR